MILSDLAIDRRITVAVMLVIIIVGGLYSYVVLPREANPEVVIPFVVVTTAYEGVAPTDIESLVTVPIERKLAGMSDVKTLQSSSFEGVSIIQIEFTPAIDIEDALQKVRDKVDQAKGDLPAEADDPVIAEINLSELPVMIVALSGEIGLAGLTKIAEELEDRIEAIQGVLDVELIGDAEREIRIVVDPQRVAEYGISLADLVTLTGVENVNTPGGSLELGEAKYLLRTPGEFRTPEELNNLVVKRGEVGTVYLRDIATVEDGFKERTTYSRVNGTPSITLTVSKRSGENMIFVSDAVQALLFEARKQFPDTVEVGVTLDQADYIRDMVAELENGILSGLILVLVVIFLFLGFSSAVFVSLAIPISMLITFWVLYLSGVTLNMVVLFSLILALGMLVDNGIVVVENIYRNIQEGKEPVEAARAGAAEVAWPVITSTLTTLAAFFPLFFWPGIMGDFMIYLPMTVTFALLGSLFVGIIVNPAMCAGLLRKHAVKARPDHPAKRAWIIRLYEKTLRVALAWRSVTVTAFVVALVVIVGTFIHDARVEFMPETEPQQAYIDIELPEGASLEASDAFVRLVEQRVAPYADDIEFIIANVGSQGASMDNPMAASANSTHLSRVTLDFPKLEETDTLPSTILEAVRQRFDDVTGAEVRLKKQEMGPPTGPPVNIEISGPDFEVLSRMAEEVKREIQDTPGLVDIRDDYDKGKPEVNVVVDRERALQTGLSTQFIGLAVKAAIEGRKAADFREGDEEYDVVVRFPDTFREDLRNIETMNLVGSSGSAIPFSAVAHIEQSAGLGVIRRIDRNRTVTVSAEVEGERSSAEVLAAVQARLANYPRPAGYRIDFTGENDEMVETQDFLGKAFVIAVFLIALVLVTQFNSIVQPFIILTSVILSLAGVFLGLHVFDMPFGILMTGIGCVSLAGVVVNNAIVLLDFINQLKARGLPVTEAIIQAGLTRFRPVMLTAVTTILGLVPMAVGISFDFRRFTWIVGGESSQWWGSMAIAVIFGLGFATALTLVMVPCLYSIVDSAVTALHPGRRAALEAEPSRG